MLSELNITTDRLQPESAYPWTNPTAAGSADSPVLSVSKRSAVPESRRPVRLALRAPSAARLMWPTDVGLGATSPRSRRFVDRSWVTSVTTVTLRSLAIITWTVWLSSR